jgi:hypothetical protein
MSTAEAVKAFETAANQNLAAIIVATNLRTVSLPSALEGESFQLLSNQIKSIVAEQPDLKSLFGSTDVCACRNCRSIYGPAAYFADVMRFLRNRLVRSTTLPPGPSTKTAKEELFKRRPDLGEIDLNCEQRRSASAAHRLSVRAARRRSRPIKASALTGSLPQAGFRKAFSRRSVRKNWRSVTMLLSMDLMLVVALYFVTKLSRSRSTVQGPTGSCGDCARLMEAQKSVLLRPSMSMQRLT